MGNVNCLLSLNDFINLGGRGCFAQKYIFNLIDTQSILMPKKKDKSLLFYTCAVKEILRKQSRFYKDKCNHSQIVLRTVKPSL